MGGARFLFLFALIVLYLGRIDAAPKPNPLQALQDRQDLVHKFAEFLHDDPEFNKALGEVEGHLVRNRRQAPGQGLDTEDIDMPQEKPGFFDRAAKFVTELLQRFLKWINNGEN